MNDTYKKIVKYSLFPILMIIMFFLFIQPAKAEVIPGELSDNAEAPPETNGTVENITGGGGESVAPEIMEELGIPKNEVITVYNTFYKTPPSCSSVGLYDTPPSEEQIDALNIPSGLKYQLKVRLRKAISETKTGSKVCYQYHLDFSSYSFKDKTKNPHAWKWKAWVASNGQGDAAFRNKYGEDALIFDKIMNNFDGYSVGLVQELIDEGYFDAWLDPSDKRDINIRRLDLIAANIKEEHYNPKTYPDEVVGWYDSDFTSHSVMMNPNLWYKQELFKQYYLAYKATGYLVYAYPKVKQTEDLITDYKPNFGDTRIYSKTPVYKKVKYSAWVHKGTNYICNEIDKASNKCEYKEWWQNIIDHYEFKYATKQYNAYVQGYYSREVSAIEQTNELADWEFVKDKIGYIEVEDNIPIPEIEKGICDYVPVLGRECRRYFTHGDESKYHTNEELERYCPCIGCATFYTEKV